MKRGAGIASTPGAAALGRASVGWSVAGLGGLSLLLAVLGISACGPNRATLSPDALLVTQAPLENPEYESAIDLLDLSYPRGSRVVLVPEPEKPERAIVLSATLRAAGAPVLGPDEKTVLFVGKSDVSSTWQVYRVDLRGGTPVPITAVEGGVTAPAWLPGGRFVFSAPVPRLPPRDTDPPPALFTQSVTGGPPARLTFGLVGATDPTVLADGRILFVSGVPTRHGLPAETTSLFTINNDGTEVTPFAGQHDGPSRTRRPRETDDGRVVFLSGGVGSQALDGRVEQVLMARPFRSRSVAFPQIAARCRAIDPAPGGLLLASLRGSAPDRETESYAIYELRPDALHAGPPAFDDPNWNDIEAVLASRPAKPMGRLSNVDPSRHDAGLLCLDARPSDRTRGHDDQATGQRIRVRCHHRTAVPEEAKLLGEVPLQADGSFLAMVPADMPLSLELLATDGSVISRCPPAFWLRPGENRACVGCHEPHNQAPSNQRPLAVRKPAVRLLPDTAQFTQKPAITPP